MNNFEQNLKRAAQEIRMSAAEKGALRARLYSAAGFGAARAASPYFSFSFQFLSIRQVAMAAFLILFVGGSTVSAAQGALPGDVLYPVKISVNERVELAFATTPEAKFHTEVRLAERRASEAQALDEKGRLDATTTLQIERAFDRHALNALALAGSVSSEEEITMVQQASEPEGEARESGALKTTEGTQEDATTMMMVVSAPSTTTATGTESTAEFRSRGESWLESLEEKREMLRELRQRAEWRERGEVRGIFDTHNEDKGDSDEDDNDRDGKDGESGEDGENGKDGKNGEDGKGNDD